jgi:hypothetical protein
VRRIAALPLLPPHWEGLHPPIQPQPQRPPPPVQPKLAMTGPAELVTCDQTIDGTIRLRNRPFDRITTHHRQLVCGPNHAILQALTDHLTGHPPPTPPSTHNPDAAASS